MLRRLSDNFRKRQRTLDAFFSHLPGLSRWRLAAAVFFCFAPTGLLPRLPSLRLVPWPYVVITAVYSGALAVMYGASAISKRRNVLIPVAIAVNVVSMMLLTRWTASGTPPTSLDPEAVVALRAHMTGVTVAAIACTALAYMFFVQLIQSEGRRFVHAQTEIRLASEIHAALVPALAGSAADVEWRGSSRPSGEVGGDLVDVQNDDDGWSACVADVSGHGVSAGLLMGMFKTAVRSARPGAMNLGAMLTSVNRTLGPLKQSHMFVTAALLHRRGPLEFEYLLAGHPQLLHVSANGRSTWVGESQLAVGLVDHVAYRSSMLTVGRGDLLVVVTDGLTEVFDARDRELGVEGLQRAVSAMTASSPLATFERAIFDAAERHGPQLDDQTLLLIRT